MQNLEQERALFENLMRRKGLACTKNGDRYLNFAMQLALEAWQARCPEGWQVVPIEPDLAMIAALGWDGDKDLALGHGAISAKMAEDFKLCLAVAPQPGEES